jgi:exopolysaccharide biosynthesis polyprenyl glycosylphosphotransferase
MNRHRWIALSLLALDLVCTIAIFNIVGRFRGLTLSSTIFVLPVIPAALAAVLAIYLVDGYKPRTDMISVDYTSQHSIALLGAMVATLLLTYVLNPEDAGYVLQSSRLVNLLGFLALIPVSLGYRRLLYLRALPSRREHAVVFLGDAASSESFHAEAERMQLPRSVIYCYSEEKAGPTATSSSSRVTLRPFREVLGEIESGKLEVEAIVLRETAREMPPQISRSLVNLYFRGVPTYTLELFHEVYWRKIPLYRLNQTWLFQEGFPIAREPVFERLKRVSDILLSLIGLLLAAPLIALSAIAIWLEDRGPVFFAQTRIGKNHAPFRLLKLRTMRHTNGPGALYTAPGDTRITRVGRFLRVSRLDEFPQLWNVLRGDMSLIGPRAEWDRLVTIYENEIPCYHFRHLVKPGITGWAQVNYPYGANIEDTVRKLEYDLYYIRHFSFLLDASIVLKTIHVMLFGKGR